MKNEYLSKFVKTEISKTNVESMKNMVPSVFAKIILDRSLVHPNIELRQFADKIAGQEYREYLYGSRTALFARLTKDAYIQYSLTVEDLRKIQKVVSEMLTWNEDQQTSSPSTPKNKKDSKESPLKQWKKIIEQG